MRMLTAFLLFVLCAGAPAQTRHDPLTSIEVDRMRDSAPDPKRRIDLLLGFARERLLAVERLRGAANPGPNRVHGDDAKAEELLGDFALLIDELDDNLAMYSKRGEDLRLSLRHVLDAEAGFQQTLKGFAEQAALPGSRGVETHGRETNGGETRGMAAALEDASDSLQSSSESANAMLAAAIRKRGEVQDEKKRGRLNSQHTSQHGSQPSGLPPAGPE